MDEGLRLNNHLRADRLVGASDIPPSPYHVRGAQMLYFLCEFDREVLGGLLPEELHAAPTNTGRQPASDVLAASGMLRDLAARMVSVEAHRISEPVALTQGTSQAPGPWLLCPRDQDISLAASCSLYR